MKEHMNKILDAYRFRHACKEFDPNKKISADYLQVHLVLSLGNLSSSKMRQYAIN
ncbi:putative NAD(P)H nitroreductase YfkO [compost metagenome]